MSSVINSVWAERYRPRTIQECVLPSHLKATFQAYVDKGDIGPVAFCGPPGMGKTSVARALCDQIGADYLIINASMNGNIDTLRTEILQFASTVSFLGGRKYVILDEADKLTIATQEALRNFSEEYSANCGLILTANAPGRLTDAIWSRFSRVDFTIPAAERNTLLSQFFKRVQTILDEQNIEYDKQTVAKLIQRTFPDMRKIMVELQRHSATGTIDPAVYAMETEGDWKSLFDYLKKQNFNDMRTWVAMHPSLEAHVVFRKLYDDLTPKLTNETAAMLMLTLAEYQHKAALVVDQEINTVACLTQIMADAHWK